MKQRSHVFKLCSYAAAFFFSSVAQDSEVRRPNFNPALIAVARSARNSQNKEETQKNG
jgi:hypothetical protein